MSNRYYSNRLKAVAERKAKSRRRKPRPKSFKTEEAAKKWAEASKITSYTLKNLRTSGSKKKKIVIVKA